MPSETLICNLALMRIGAERITDIETDESKNAQYCRQQYYQARDALLRSHFWRFATGRATLSEDTNTPDFGYDHQYILPNDFLRMLVLYDSDATYSLEGNRLLVDDDSADIIYVKQIKKPAEFDPLFIEVLVLQLAIKLVMPIAGDKVLRREMVDELRGLMIRVKTIDSQETSTIGDDDRNLWNDSRQ